MKFQVQKKHLADVIDRMSNVATRGIKSEWDKACQITVKTDSNKILFLTSNGHLEAIMEIDDQKDTNLKIETQGAFTADVSVFKKVIQSLGKDDCIFSLSLEKKDNSEALYIKDISSKNKKNVKLEVSVLSHDFSISKPKSGFSYTFETRLFCDIISYISKYRAILDYKVKFMMVCLHFLKDKTRFICGDGMRFAIEECELEKPNPLVDTDDGIKYLLPVDQAGIIASIIDDSNTIEFIFKNEHEYYIKPQNGLTLCLKGIPNEKYLNYEKYAYVTDQSVTIIDVKRDDFFEAMNVLRAVEDKDRISKGNFHSCNFIAKDNKLSLSVSEGRYQADIECDIDTYGNKAFTSCYYHAHLNDISRVDTPLIRFWCNDPMGTVIVEMLDPDVNKKTLLDAPAAKKSVTKSTFFFAALKDEE